MIRIRTAGPALLASAAIAVVAAGCGSSNDNNSSSSASTPAPATTQTQTQTTTKSGGGTSAASGTVKISADPSGQLKFEQSEVTAKAGKVTIDFENKAPVPHDVAIEQNGKDVTKTKIISGGSDSTSATLKAGEYTFYCTVPGHRQAGMEGKLIVK